MADAFKALFEYLRKTWVSSFTKKKKKSVYPQKNTLYHCTLFPKQCLMTQKGSVNCNFRAID